eukprot:scaffold7119_cov129-Isochrysis_galbana.AAC.6
MFCLIVLGASQPWNARAASDYVQARCGRTGGRDVYWCGEGTLKRSSGHRIADIDYLEKATREGPGGKSPGGTFRVDRMVIYRDVSGNGTVLSLPAGRRGMRRLVPPLEYSHHVGIALTESGKPEAVALRPDGVVVARARTLHASVRRRLFSRAFALQLQLERFKGKGALSGVASVAGVGGGKLASTVEEYELHVPLCPGLPAEMRYRRTGPCPSWCGGGLCTTDLWMRQRRRPYFADMMAKCRRDVSAPVAETRRTRDAEEVARADT